MCNRSSNHLDSCCYLITVLDSCCGSPTNMHFFGSLSSATSVSASTACAAVLCIHIVKRQCIDMICVLDKICDASALQL
jgi:hypothetical protein